MKKLLISVCICSLFVACNEPSKEEIKPMENKEIIVNNQKQKIKKKAAYTMDFCGKVYKAVLAKDINAVKRALADGGEDGDKFCALHFIIEQGYHRAYSDTDIKIVKILLANKADVNAHMFLITDYSDNSLLEKATYANSAILVKLLLEAGANIESKNRALNLATRDNHIEIVKLLLAAGIDDTVKNEAHSYAIDLHHFEIAKLLLSTGSKVKGNNLVAAAEGGNTSLVKTILNSGVGKDDKRKALLKAVESSDTEIVKLLLEAGTDINGYKNSDKSSSQGGIRVYNIWEDSALETALKRQEQIQESKRHLQKMIDMESDPNCLGCGPDEEEISKLERLQKAEKNIAEIIKLLKQAETKE